MNAAYAVTLDVGGSHVTAALVQLPERRIERLARRAVHHDAPQLTLLRTWAEAALEALGHPDVALAHVGVAVPSPFDAQAGISRMEHKFPALREVPLRPALAQLLKGTPLAHVPILFGNDADLFALGEWWAGAGQGCARLIGLTLGTGLGSGFIRDGQIMTAGRGVPPDGELWNRPYRGEIAETFACGAALTRAWEALRGHRLSARELAAKAEAGDTAAQAVFRAFGHDLAEILHPWISSFQTERVVLGGNVSRAFPLFGPALQADLPACDVRISGHFEQAGLLGAAVLTS